MSGSLENQPSFRGGSLPGFTLLEVLVAMAVLAISLLALLTLHEQSIRTVIRGQDTSRAALLAQAIISQAELERFPPLGDMKGNFEKLFPKQYPNYRWERRVTASGAFPDVRKARVIIYYGPRFTDSFALTEYIHNPIPINPETGAPEEGGANNPGGSPMPSMPPMNIQPPNIELQLPTTLPGLQ